uniref:Reverse transcriptase domain-containing protein n=1 Tax=Tanacetum cinerariifolium TaxID=118510 RepID=A0A6L2J3K2_TANCI|nr:reverse transcriptase domain-containing protein [Tanacetum cinerariifolium]
MPPKRTSTSRAPAMTQAAIRQLVADSIITAQEAQTANMENADNTNRNPEPIEAPVVTDINKRTKSKLKPDKTEHEMESVEKSKVNPVKVKVKDEAKAEELRPLVDPTILNDFEMAIDGNGDPLVPGLRTMEELCQPTLNGGTFMKRRPEECYDLIENMTAYHNDWDTSVQQSKSSSSITSSSDLEIVALKAEMAEINQNLKIVL